MTPSLTDRVAGRVTVLAGAAIAAGGAIQATRPDIDETRVETFTEHLLISLFAVGAALLVPATLALGRRAGTRLASRAAAAAATGQVILAAAATWSNVTGDDAAWFPAVASVTNLMWLGGWIVIAVGLRRAGAVPRAVAFGIPLSWAVALPLSRFGGGLLAGGFWIAVGVALAAGTLGVHAAGVGRREATVSR